ncbi:MAG: futalosine hydrolase [Deltaproteobacteria bacterium]|jgi:futalosine hydrolase|nr:futalosine hydrolase [Deltaproteobacteria bacterium]
MILILAATPLETALLRKRISSQQTSACGSYQIFNGTLQGLEVLLAHGGIGTVNMASQLTTLLHEHSPQTVFLVGCGGSYPGSQLQIGNLALAATEIYGDLGVMTAEGFIPLEQLKLPQDHSLAPLVQQQFDLDTDLLAWAQEILPEAVCGPFVTLNCCSGNPEMSEKIAQRTGGICENMEGAAAAQVCSAFDLPLLELRGISNPTGTRDPEQWDIIKGAEAAQLGILELLQNWPVA